MRWRVPFSPPAKRDFGRNPNTNWSPVIRISSIGLRLPSKALMKSPDGFSVSAPSILSHQARPCGSLGTVMSQAPLKPDSAHSDETLIVVKHRRGTVLNGSLQQIIDRFSF